MKANIESFLNFCDASNRGCRDLWESLVREKARLGQSIFKTVGIDIELCRGLLAKNFKTTQLVFRTKESAVLTQFRSLQSRNRENPITSSIKHAILPPKNKQQNRWLYNLLFSQ